MSLLLDTRVLLWWLDDDSSLSEEAKIGIANEPAIFISAATIWEIAIKETAGKLRAPEHLIDYVELSGFQPLPISFQHARIAGSLPRHHSDPFDRMLVAQAAIEGLTVVTRDSRFARYGVSMLLA